MLPILFHQVIRIVGLVSVISPTSFTISNNDNSQSEVLLDYGSAVGGLPFFNISHASSSTSENVSFQIVLSETIREIDYPNGDGPFFLFSNAMDSYRNTTYTVPASTEFEILEGRFLQASQRYLRLRLTSPNASIAFSGVGFRPVREEVKPVATFSSSNKLLNDIWQQGARTVDKCTVAAGETIPAWNVHNEGTRVYGQHWAPCMFGTRWSNYTTRFEVQTEEFGASWGVRMVANGLIFLLDKSQRQLRAFEGLSDESSVFPSVPQGVWPIPDDVDLENWINITTNVSGPIVSVYFGDNETAVAEVKNVNIAPTLGGAPNNTGSIAFGGPQGWQFSVRNLIVRSLTGEELYTNSLLPADAARTLADFAVGTNSVANTVDGAKRDRATFGGDLHVMGRSIAYSTQAFEAVKGSIELLTSHQTSEGYLGNLAPIQAPLWNEAADGEAPTYAFYSLTYASLLIVAIKNYWLHSGDEGLLGEVLLEKLRRQLNFAESYLNPDGLVEAPPELSLTFLPLGGPVFGASTPLNMAYYDALQSMALLTPNSTEAISFRDRAAALKANIISHLYNPTTGSLRLSSSTAATGIPQDANSYGITLGISPPHISQISTLSQSSDLLPNAFGNLTGWSDFQLCSPYTTAPAVEALFTLDAGPQAVALIERVWGVMANKSNPNFSGGHWEAMTLEGEPYQNTTSLNHGWSTGPVYLLPMYLAGLRPVKPGWKEWEARPVYAGIEEVDANVPTKYGVAEIAWRFCEKSGNGSVEWCEPVGTKGTVYPPSGWTFAKKQDNRTWAETGMLVCGAESWHRRELRRES